MANRTVVRQGPVVMISLTTVLFVASLGSGPDGASIAPVVAKDKDKQAVVAAPTPVKTAVITPELKPYKIKAWLSVDPLARVDGRGRETLIAGWKMMVKRFVGRPWELEIAAGDGPLATNALDDILPETIIPEAKGFDKIWLFRVEPSDDGIIVAGREFDSATAQIGLVCRRPAQVLADGPRALLQLSLDVFAASSEIADAPEPKKRRIRVQGAMIPAATPVGEVVSVGSVFRPSRIFYKPEGGIQRLDIINSTYLLVERIDGGIATCRIISGLQNALTEKVVGKAKMVAVGLKPASIPTRIRFTFANLEATSGPVKPEERPAAGYTVVARPAPDGTPREVGTTDRDGRIYLAPGFADGLVSLRLLAAGTEPLIEFPVMPGEMLGEKWMKGIDPRGRAVTAESDLFALRDEIVDLIGARSRLEYKMRARANAKSDNPNLAEIKILMDEFKALPPKDSIVKRHAKIDEDLKVAAQENPREQVRTRSALALLKDVGVLIERYLDDDPYKEVEIFYNESMAAANASKNQAKALPKMPKIGVKPAGATAAASGPVDFSPPSGGFNVMMPGEPTESTAKIPNNSADVTTFKVAVPGKGVFSASYWDYPVAIAATDTAKVLDTERDRLLTTIPGSKITRDLPTLVSGLEGKEIEFEGPPAKTGEVPVIIARIALSNSRVISAYVGGTKALVTAPAANDFLNSLKIAGKGGKAVAGGSAPAEQPKSAADPRTSTSAGAASAIDKAKDKAKKAAEKSNGGGSAPF